MKNHSTPLFSAWLPARALAFVLALGSIAACSTWSGAPAASGASGLAYVAEQGELRVGMSGEQPPLSMTARNGEMLGLDVALARVLAQIMGAELRLVQMPFGELLGALERNEIDLVMSGMTITPKRSRRAHMVGPYFTSGKTLLTRSAELAAVQTPEELDSADIRLGALAGSTSEDFARLRMPTATLETSAGLDDAIARLLAGEIDALLADRETCHFAVLRHPDAGLLAAEVTFTIEPMGIATPAGDARFARLVQSYLEALEDRGALQEARDFWFRDDAWVAELR